MALEATLSRIEREERAQPPVLTPAQWAYRAVASIALAFAPYMMSTNANAAEEVTLTKAQSPTIEQRVGDDKTKPKETKNDKDKTENTKDNPKISDTTQTKKDYAKELQEIVAKVEVPKGKEYEFYNNTTVGFRKQKKYFESVAYLNKAITLQPNRSSAYINLANTLGHMAESEKDANKRKWLFEESIKKANLVIPLAKKELDSNFLTQAQYDRKLIGSYAETAFAYESLGDRASALKFYKLASALQKKPSKFISTALTRLEK